MSVFSRKEDSADLWLREHDPYYSDKNRSKRRGLKYPYDTPEQEKRRITAEIPISNLNDSQKISFKNMAGAYDDGGNFDL